MVGWHCSANVYAVLVSHKISEISVYWTRFLVVGIFYKVRVSSVSSLELSGCIECMSIVCGVCLSRGSSRLHCAKRLDRSRCCLGWTLVGQPRNIVLDGGPDLPTVTRRRGIRCSLRQITLAFCSCESRCNSHGISAVNSASVAGGISVILSPWQTTQVLRPRNSYEKLARETWTE